MESQPSADASVVEDMRRKLRDYVCNKEHPRISIEKNSSDRVPCRLGCGEPLADGQYRANIWDFMRHSGE